MRVDALHLFSQRQSLDTHHFNTASPPGMVQIGTDIVTYGVEGAHTWLVPGHNYTSWADHYLNNLDLNLPL